MSYQGRRAHGSWLLAIVFALALGVLLALPGLAFGATFSAAAPAAGTTVTVSPAAVSIDAATAAPIVGTPVVTVDGRPCPASVAFAVLTPGYWWYDEELEWDYWIPPVYDYKRATITCAPGVLTDGQHTVTVTLPAAAGTFSWAFGVSERPVLGAVTPAAGTTTMTPAPAVTVKATDNSAVTAYSATIDGAVVPATYDALSQTLRLTPASLTNFASHTAAVTVADALGNTASKSWTFTISAPVTTWSGRVPAPGAVITTTPPSGVSANVQCTSALRSDIKSVVFDGVPVSNVVWLKPYPGDATRATIVGYPSASGRDGTHTVSITATTVQGTTSTDTWSYSVRIVPTVGTPVPANGSTVTTRTPAILVSAADNSGIATVSATINGSPAPAAFDAATGIVRVTPASPLADDATSIVTVSVFDALGLRRDVTWSFEVEAGQVMSGSADSCESCHPGIGADPDMSPWCEQCHVEHEGTTSSYHKKADVSACRPCHVSALLVEHARPGLTCQTCHDSAAAKVRTAIANGDSACASCHGELAAGHLAVHESSAASMAVPGTTAVCGDCHDANLMTEHSKPTASSAATGCPTCHPDPRASVGSWDESCVTGACHSVDSSAPMHAAAPAAHARAGRGQACFGAGCHADAALDAIHAEQGCATCHAAGMTPTGDCTSCHGDSAPHPHPADPGSDAVSLLPWGTNHANEAGYDAGVYVDCKMCHAPDLVVVHGGECATCHASTDSRVKNTIAAGFSSCWDCHTSAHPNAASGHDSVYNSGDCGACHESDWSVSEYSCGNCHALIDTQPPTTGSDARASYVGPATIHLSPSDPYPSEGIAHTYYVLDGAAPAEGTSFTVSPPASGSATHTIEFWSIDNGGRTETTHKAATFRVARDITAPVTTSNAKTSYTGIARITLTATDDATQYGVRATYYKLDGGPETAATSITIPNPVVTTPHTLEFWSVDWSGNRETTKTATFTCVGDTAPPVPTVTLLRYLTSNYFTGATLRATDVGDSGVAAMYATVDNGGPTLLTMGGPSNGSAMSLASYTPTFAEGWYNLRYWAIDAAGNSSSHEATTFCFDRKSPSITWPFTSGQTFAGPTTIAPTIVEAVSGVNTATAQFSVSYHDSTGGWITSYINGATSFVATAAASGTRQYSISFTCRDLANNYGTNGVGFYITAVPDTVAPTGSVVINGGAAWTNATAATLTLSASDTGGSGLSQMRFSNDNIAWSAWETYATSKSWTLAAGAGTKTVYAQFRDVAGNVSTTANDTIGLDLAAPSGSMSVNAAASYANTTAVTVTSAVTDPSGSGVTSMSVDPGTGTYGSWVGYAASSPIVMQAGDGTKTVRVQYRDAAGNVSTLTDTIVLDTTAPAGTMSVNGGAVTATSTAATVNSAVTDGGSGVASMSVDPGTGTYGSWAAYSASRAFTLAGGDGTKTVRVQYVDAAGNVATLTDTIVLSTGVPDTTAPRTTSDAKATYEAPATILLTPTDEAGGSGVAHTYYKLDGGAQSEGLTVTTSSLGAHTLEFWSVDNASNAETPHNTAAFTVFAPGSGPRTFSFTGGDQTYTVADGVTAVDVDLYGGAGGGIDGIGGGLGGHVHATIPVTVGQVLTLKVGGAGAGDGGTAGGWPTGGAGDGSHGAAGGGSSSILLGTTILAEAGGGGGADHADGPGGDGGAQGWLPGGGQTGDNQGGAGGGGGWNGGAAYPAHEGGGDGGTSYIAVGTGTLTAGVQNGDGSIVVTPVRGGNSRTFAATGADQSFTVPDGVSAITVDLKGAQGGNGGGLGGVVHATIPVTAGELLTVRVGDTAGWPNGGAGTDSGGAGGGSSSVLLGTAVLAEAGGGGGFAGGGEPGGAGGASLASDPGGNDFGADGYMYGAGGGGGWNGGDSPGDDTSGSGGTSRIAVGTGTMTAGAWEGDGSVVISW